MITVVLQTRQTVISSTTSSHPSNGPVRWSLDEEDCWRVVEWRQVEAAAGLEERANLSRSLQQARERPRVSFDSIQGIQNKVRKRCTMTMVQ
jgi:hypothetical protein